MAQLNEVIHQPVRLRIMAILAAVPAERQVAFSFLKGTLGLTDGNLGAHLHKLEEAGFLTITTGLLLQQRLFIILGIGITVMTALGYWLVPTYFWLWIAVFAGLPLIGVSVYLLRRR